MTKRFVEEVKKIVEDEYGRICDKKDGCLFYEIYADYRDEISAKTAIKILESEDPENAFDEELYECYFDSQSDYELELQELVQRRLTAPNGPFPNGLDPRDDDEDALLDLLRDLICFSLPYSHFLSQEFYVPIMLDTGDGNYDYSLNSVYPCYYGDPQRAYDDKAGIVWLAKQQGYKKGELRKEMNKGDIGDPKGFLESMRQELANLPSSMATVTFLVKMTLGDLIELNKLIRLQDRDGHHYDATKNPYCGYIVLDKSTETGLYDPWSGGGSVLEVQLEKDVKLPIKYIRSALPDGGDGYAIQNVYGLCGSCWKSTLKEIHRPKKI